MESLLEECDPVDVQRAAALCMVDDDPTLQATRCGCTTMRRDGRIPKAPSLRRLACRSSVIVRRWSHSVHDASARMTLSTNVLSLDSERMIGNYVLG